MVGGVGVAGDDDRMVNMTDGLPDIDAIFSGFEHRYVEIDDCMMHYLEGGSGETLVLVHGWSNNCLGWWPLVQLLRDHYHLVLVDMPGFGKSDDLPRYDIETEADYLARLVEKIELEPLAMVGLSMGSQVLSHFGKQYSELTQSLVLFGSVFHTNRRKRATQKAMKLFLQGVGKGKRISRLFKRVIEDERFAILTSKYINMYKLNMELVKVNQEGRKEMRIETFIQMGISEAVYKIEESLDGVEVPVLLAFGEHDKVTKVEEAMEMLSDAEGDFSFASIPEGGHVAPMEQPALTVAVLEQFLSRVREE